jgi:hypothetical protein
MQYILLVYENVQRWAELSKAEKNQIHSECSEWHERLVQTGQALVQRPSSDFHGDNGATEERSTHC